MESVEAIKDAIAKCDFYIDEELISGADLLQAFFDYMVNGISDEKKFYGVTLHTGSKVFDAAAIVFAAFTNLVNSTDPEEIISSLKIGDYVLYDQKRWIYMGKCPSPIDKKKTVILLEGKEETKEKDYVPEKGWNKIIPYNGTSTRKDGRGIQRKNPVRESFYIEVLGYQPTDVSNLTDTSSVLIISRARAEIIERISIRFNEKKARLLDLITATYYSENSEVPFGGNIGQNEPILKLTSKASVARRLIKQQDGNEHIGLIISGNNTIGRNFTEIQELTVLRSLRYILILTQIDSEYGRDLINFSENTELFACTKSFVKKHKLPERNESGAIMQEFCDQMSIISECENEACNVISELTWEQYKDFKQTMLRIKQSELSGSQTESFIINAYSLMNLFLTCVFSIGDLEEQIKEGLVTSVISPSDKIEELENQVKVFPKALSDLAGIIMGFLQSCWLMFADKCEKKDELLSLLKKYHNQKTAIIVPKEYYGTVLRNLDIYSVIDTPELLTIVTPNQFDHDKIYDVIICVGMLRGHRFDMFRCRSAKLIISLVYDFEKRIYTSQKKRAKAVEELYNAKLENRTATEIIESEQDSINNAHETDNEVVSFETITYELDEYIRKLQEKADLRVLASYSGNASATAECISSAVFEDEKRCFFTKRYKAYVIDKSTGDTYEKDAEKLVEGDSLIFTINNENTRDIVDDMLQKLIIKLDERVQESYRKSKEWRRVLKEYTDVVGTKEAVSALKQAGVTVKPGTIRHWLDVDSHQVGVQRVEYFKGIGKATGHTDLYENPQMYYDACAEVKRVRGEILKYIGQAIIKKISGVVPKQDELMAEIYDRLDSSAVVLRIESIREINMKVPISLVNRPITLKE